MTLRRTRSTLLPYTTLFRSRDLAGDLLIEGARLFNPQTLRPLPEQHVRREHLATFFQTENHPIGSRLFNDGLQTRKDRKSTRLNSSHGYISYAVFCLKKKIQ